ncbi:hypothetical protein EVAR_61300_1 [Eumeta japonica]|uniref:Uncharacterized protein n=1 Tax=Eumeta variegata TaxID=151549 RepID=A0A4C1XKC1_EUMVA|nr:hypothetical protein EVAR_61300_1 [Eumeta japonica]
MGQCDVRTGMTHCRFGLFPAESEGTGQARRGPDVQGGPCILSRPRRPGVGRQPLPVDVAVTMTTSRTDRHNVLSKALSE